MSVSLSSNIMTVAYYFKGANGRRNLTRQITDWFAKTYIGKHKISIDFIARGMLREGDYGTCCIVDSVSRPRAFEINIHNRLTTIDFITTLVHELIHVQQRVHREHVTKYNKNYWARKHVPSDTCYADQPWEQAAHFLESRIAARAIRDLNLVV